MPEKALKLAFEVAVDASVSAADPLSFPVDKMVPPMEDPVVIKYDFS